MSTSDGPRSWAPSVLWKAFHVLDAFDRQNRVLTLAQIARHSGLPKSTVHRVLAMLSDVGAVEPHGDGYRIGLRMFSIGSLPPELALREAAMVHLEEAHRVTGQTMHLAVLRDGESVYLEKLSTRRSVTTPAAVGNRLPASCTAVGKAMLAFSAPEVTAAAISTPMSARTAHTLTTPASIHRQLDAARRNGYALDREESANGLACIAVPILVRHHPIAAISVAFPASAGDGQVLLGPLRQVSAAISRSTALLSADLMAAG